MSPEFHNIDQQYKQYGKLLNRVMQNPSIGRNNLKNLKTTSHKHGLTLKTYCITRLKKFTLIIVNQQPNKQ